LFALWFLFVFFQHQRNLAWEFLQDSCHYC
jgi:hypothetical protein